MRLPAGARVLELGCSTGTFLRSLRRDCGVEAHGVDVSMRSLVRAAQLAPDAHWYQASAHRLPFRDGSFDALFAFDVLEHVGDYSGAIQAIARVLRPGGVALLHVPVSDIEGSFDAIWKTHWPARYWAEQAQAGHAAAHMRSKRELMHDCDAVGLRVERVTRFNVLLQNIFDYRSRHRILGRAFNGRRIPFGVYHRLVAPFIELFTVVPDRALAAAADIGASVYLRVRRDGNVPAARTDPVHVAVADAEAAP
jgi:SAM-dependent methyltransferase